MYVITQTNEFFSDESGKIYRFKNTKSARDFLRDIGIRKPEKQGIQIIPEPAQETVLQSEISSCSK